MSQIGIVVTAEDSATGVLAKIGSVTKKALQSVEKTAEGAKKQFSLLGGTITAVNQAAELGKKAWEVARFAIADTIKESLQFRKESDPIIKWFADLERSSRRARAEIGNIMIPIIKGLAEGLGLVGDGISDWIAENRKLIASGLLGWLSSVGNVLISTVGAGVSLVADAWYGWLEVIGLVQLGVNRYYDNLLSGLSSALAALARVADFVGSEGLAGTLNRLSESAAGLGSEFGRSADESALAITRAASAAEEFQTKVDNLTTGALDTWHSAVVMAQDEIAVSARATKTALDEVSDSVTKSGEEVMSLSDRIDAMVRRRDRARRQVLAAQEAASIASSEIQQERLQELGDAAHSISQGIVAGFFDQENAAKEAAKGAAVALIDTISVKLSAYAAEAIAASLAGHAGIPFGGQALGAIAGAAIAGSILALGAGLKGAISGLAGGGVIGGGVPGRDSVPALLMPGEQVMSVAERDGVQKFLGRLFSGSQQQPSGSIGGNQTIIINNQALVPDQIAFDRVTNRQQRSLHRLQKQRLLYNQGTVV